MAEDTLDNPIWQALNTEHAELAVGDSVARRYPADVAPFAGFEPDCLKTNPVESLRRLFALLSPGESIWVGGDEIPPFDGLTVTAELEALQMNCPDPPTASNALDETLVRLTPADAPAMVALTDLAFPGFFRPRTYRMGRYYGIRVGARLVAMAGERMALPGYREISAVCTHPEHTGRGYAGRLMAQIMREHSSSGIVSFLHVSSENQRAIALYERLRFIKRKTVRLRHLLRNAG